MYKDFENLKELCDVLKDFLDNTVSKFEDDLANLTADLKKKGKRSDGLHNKLQSLIDFFIPGKRKKKKGDGGDGKGGGPGRGGSGDVVDIEHTVDPNTNNGDAGIDQTVSAGDPADSSLHKRRTRDEGVSVAVDTGDTKRDIMNPGPVGTPLTGYDTGTRDGTGTREAIETESIDIPKSDSGSTDIRRSSDIEDKRDPEDGRELLAPKPTILYGTEGIHVFTCYDPYKDSWVSQSTKKSLLLFPNAARPLIENIQTFND